jgi:hypothetical protein
VSFSVKGEYFEACTCTVSCPCIWVQPATQDGCDLMLAWHVTEGQMDGVDLSGLNAMMAVRTPKMMTDGGWRVALYLDDRASEEQSAALGAVFSGGAGGHLAALAPLIGEVAGVAPASISFDRDGRAFSASAAGVASVAVEEVVGMDGASPAVISNPTMGVVPQPVRQAVAASGSYHDHWDTEFSGTNSFVTDFAYEG